MDKRKKRYLVKKSFIFDYNPITYKANKGDILDYVYWNLGRLVLRNKKGYQLSFNKKQIEEYLENYNGFKATCPFCTDGDDFLWVTKSFQNNAGDVVRDRLQNHLEEEHLELMSEIFMNNQCSDSIEEIKRN